MKNIAKIKQSIQSEMRGKAMQERIRVKAEQMVKELGDDIADEIGEIAGKLKTDFIDKGSAIESELMAYAFDKINDALLDPVFRTGTPQN